MSNSTEAISLGTLARKFNVRFSLTPSDVMVAGRQATGGFDLHLVGTHVNPMPANAGTCKHCQKVLLALLELAECAMPNRPTKRPSRPENNFRKLTRFSAGHGCAGEVSLTVELFRCGAFEDPADGWAMDSLMGTTKLLLGHGCRQVIEGRTGQEMLVQAGSHSLGERSTHVPDRLLNEGGAYG